MATYSSMQLGENECEEAGDVCLGRSVARSSPRRSVGRTGGNSGTLVVVEHARYSCPLPPRCFQSLHPSLTWSKHLWRAGWAAVQSVSVVEISHLSKTSRDSVSLRGFIIILLLFRLLSGTDGGRVANSRAQGAKRDLRKKFWRGKSRARLPMLLEKVDNIMYRRNPSQPGCFVIQNS